MSILRVFAGDFVLSARWSSICLEEESPDIPAHASKGAKRRKRPSSRGCFRHYVNLRAFVEAFSVKTIILRNVAAYPDCLLIQKDGRRPQNRSNRGDGSVDYPVNGNRFSPRLGLATETTASLSRESKKRAALDRRDSTSWAIDCRTIGEGARNGSISPDES